MTVDLDRQLKIPDHIAKGRTERPDIVLYSNATKQVLMVELTVPFEDRIELSNELKRSKYEDLRLECEKNSWRCQVWPVEVGARGFTGRSLGALLKEVVVVGVERKKNVDELAAAAEEASRIIWNKHQQKEWYNSKWD